MFAPVSQRLGTLGMRSVPRARAHRSWLWAASRRCPVVITRFLRTIIDQSFERGLTWPQTRPSPRSSLSGGFDGPTVDDGDVFTACCGACGDMSLVTPDRRVIMSPKGQKSVSPCVILLYFHFPLFNNNERFNYLLMAALSDALGSPSCDRLHAISL